MENVQGHGNWKSCTQQEICALKLTRDQYYPVTSDPEYLDNWVDKLNMMCMSQSDVGFLGSCFFIGIIASILWVPKFADTYGRLPCILIALSLQVISLIGVYISTNIRVTYFFLFSLGMTFPGKNIIWYNYCIEITKERYKEMTVNTILIVESFAIIYVAFFYQYIDNRWWVLQRISILSTIFCTVFTFMYFPESPKFLYSQGKYEMARANLKKIAAFNGNYEFDKHSFHFDKES